MLMSESHCRKEQVRCVLCQTGITSYVTVTITITVVAARVSGTAAMRATQIDITTHSEF